MGRSITLLSFMVLLMIVGCEAPYLGPVITQEVYVDPFHKLDIACEADVCVRQDNYFEVLIEGPEEAVYNYEVYEKNGWLKVKRRGPSNGSVKIFVTMPELRKVEHTGSGLIYSDSHFYVNKDLEIDNNGSGDIDLSVSVRDLDIVNRGSGETYLIGNARELKLRINGSGDFRGFDLDLEEAIIDNNASGDVEVYAKYYLDVEINGSGNVFYMGYPDIFLDIRGSGDLIDAN